MKRIVKSAILILFILLCFSSCKRGNHPRLYLDGEFSFALCDEDCEIEEADARAYYPLRLKGYRNISKTVGNTGQFLWLRTSFRIPEELKDKDLAMVIPYLHYACELYLNGEFIDDYGFMAEPRQEAGFAAQLFDFPEDFLNQDGENIIHIKVLSLGQSTISQNVFIGERDDCWAMSDFHTFWQSRIYIFFEGALISVFLLFLILFVLTKKDEFYLIFAFLCLVSALFFSNFFAGELPDVGFHGGIPFFLYIKIFRCTTFFAMEFLFTLFVFSFLEVPHHKMDLIMRGIAAVICVVTVFLTKDYVQLIKVTPFVFIISSIDVVFSFGLIGKNLFSDIEDRRRKARFLISALIPLIFALILDAIIKFICKNILVTYFALPAYTITIFCIFTNFTIQYKRISNRLEYLSRSLEDEVEIQTKHLTEANDKLEREQEIAQEDMSMAALVQKKFFHTPNHPLSKWEVSVRYEPLSIVSGDLYNFYTEEDMLNGLSLFDASGHGVAASLVTMLAENIIQQTYKESLEIGRGMAETLTVINERFIAAKDGIDNYLTGVLLSVKENDDGSCTITLANAGHPNPLLFNASTGCVEEILPDVSTPSYGAVGIKGFEVCYAEIEFNMNSGDVLLLFTDGLIEMMNENHEEFGIDRAMTVLSEIHGMSAQEMLSALMFAFNAHVYSVPRTDDVSVIVIKRK